MIDFPHIQTAEAFAGWRSDRERWGSAARGIAELERIPITRMSPFSSGTNLVVDLDGRSILKLFPPIFRSQFVSELATLRHLADRLSIPTPLVEAEGGQDGWSWLIITKLGGMAGSEVWPTLPEDNKETILEEVGRAIAEVQAVPPGPLSEIEPAWPDFIARQVEGCMQRHRRKGLPAHLLEDIPQLLAEVPTAIPLDGPHVILTGEWIPENFLLHETNGRWRLAAVIDFGDVMTGWREYDLLGPSAFMCAGRPAGWKRLLEGYGIGPDDFGPEMRRRLLTLMLLHRASDLRKVAIDGWESRIGSLLDLEELVWPS